VLVPRLKPPPSAGSFTRITTPSLNRPSTCWRAGSSGIWRNAAGDRDEFPAVFGVIDDLHLRGDQYVCELATIGFLEDLQNTNPSSRGQQPR